MTDFVNDKLIDLPFLFQAIQYDSLEIDESIYYNVLKCFFGNFEDQWVDLPLSASLWQMMSDCLNIQQPVVMSLTDHSIGGRALKNKPPLTNYARGDYYCFWLTRQGSNLDSSEPKSDVLPITPRVNQVANLKLFLFLL